MPNTRMITLTNILDKKFETMGANNSDVSKMISKIVINKESEEARQYHINRYISYYEYIILDLRVAYDLREKNRKRWSIYKNHECTQKIMGLGRRIYICQCYHLTIDLTLDRYRTPRYLHRYKNYMLSN